MISREELNDAYAMTVPNLRRRANAIYLACDESVACDISAALLWAASEIERLSASAQRRQEPEACPYAIDGCVLENQEIGPCLCALTSTECWPAGCHDPDSCARHRACMYVQCKRHGKDGNEVAEEISASVGGEKS